MIPQRVKAGSSSTSTVTMLPGLPLKESTQSTESEFIVIKFYGYILVIAAFFQVLFLVSIHLDRGEIAIVRLFDKNVKHLNRGAIENKRYIT